MPEIGSPFKVVITTVGRSGGALSGGRQAIFAVSRRGCTYAASKFMVLVRLLGWWGLSWSSRQRTPIRDLTLCDTSEPRLETVALLGP